MERIIYDNYDLYDLFDDTKQLLMDCYPEYCSCEVECADGTIRMEPTDDKVWDWTYMASDDQWRDVFDELKRFFNNKKLIMFGSVGRWSGCCSGAEIGSFEDLFYDIVKDCDYIKISDRNGHFLLECSHHDGTNYVEFKELSDKGYELYDNWEYSYGNGRTVNYGNEQFFSLLVNSNFYSKLPHFFKKVWGE